MAILWPLDPVFHSKTPCLWKNGGKNRLFLFVKMWYLMYREATRSMMRRCPEYEML
jgi:hypothetical protein